MEPEPEAEEPLPQHVEIRDGQNATQASESVINQLTPQYGNWRSFDRIGENLISVYEKLKV